MAKNASHGLKQLARRLLAHEAASGKPSDAPNSTAFHLCEKLRTPLGKLLGQAGFRALLGRALVLAGKEAPWLLALQIQPDGSIEGLDELEERFKARVVAEGEVALVAELLSLLVTFIGKDLTQRFLSEIWVELKDLTF